MKLKIPFTVKLDRFTGTNQIADWLIQNNAFDRVSHNWTNGTLSFEDEEDALAFCIKFGAHRYETTVERMLNLEESNN
jgi:hypothetical protein